MKMSQRGTPFRGIHAIGSGGYGSREYYRSDPVMNVTNAFVEVRGKQALYIKPSTIDTRAMLRRKFQQIYNGQYPCNTVQQMFNGNQSESQSQGVYIQNKGSSAVCDLGMHKPNNPNMYKVSSSDYIRYRQRKCIYQRPDQEPWPPTVSTGTGIVHGGTTLQTSSCGISPIISQR